MLEPQTLQTVVKYVCLVGRPLVLTVLAARCLLLEAPVALAVVCSSLVEPAQLGQAVTLKSLRAIPAQVPLELRYQSLQVVGAAVARYAFPLALRPALAVREARWHSLAARGLLAAVYR